MQLLATHPIKKMDLGFHGNLFGGKLLFGSKLLFIINTSMRKNYREIWEAYHGPIPVDELGRSYDIHHKDGNRNNNSLDNLQCVSIEEHYRIHLEQGDYFAAKLVGYRAGKDLSELKGYKHSDKTKEQIRQKLKGKKRKLETLQKISEKRKGKPCTPESVEARKQGIKNYYLEADKNELEKRWAKISEAHKGKVLKSETKEKLGRASAKLTDKQALEVHKLANSGYAYAKIAEEFKISKAQISALKNKKSYKWLWIC